ncbi:MAG: DUF3048 domain-containing protein [Anaerolineae bacterium]
MKRRVFHNQLGGMLLLIFLVSCLPAEQAAIPPATPTATPFQPQPGVFDSPYAAAIPVLPAPNATSDPTAAALPQPTPAVLLSTAGQNVSLSPLYTDPLTGLSPTDPALLNRRPLAIKIANAPDYIRPQSGLSLADVVFEYYIEWGDTRFIAIFYGNNAERIGPVRSGRFFDEHIVRMYHAFYAFKYADPRVYSYFQGGDLEPFLVVPAFGECPPFLKVKRRLPNGAIVEDYNSVYFDLTRWPTCAAKRKVDNTRPLLRSGFFSEQAADSPFPAQRIYTFYSPYNYNYWQYDAQNHNYVRYQETSNALDGKPEAYAPLSDALTGQPITAANVIVLFVPHTFADANQAEDEVYHIDLLNSGEAYVFRDGLAYPARWYRDHPDQPLLITTLWNTPIYLHPGNTFYEVIGTSSTTSQDGADWRFTFQTP